MSILAQLLWLVIDVVAVVRLSKQEKDIEVLLLRQQLCILDRKQRHPPRLTRWEKLTLAVLAAWLKEKTARA